MHEREVGNDGASRPTWRVIYAALFIAVGALTLAGMTLAWRAHDLPVWPASRRGVGALLVIAALLAVAGLLIRGGNRRGALVVLGAMLLACPGLIVQTGLSLSLPAPWYSSFLPGIAIALGAGVVASRVRWRAWGDYWLFLMLAAIGLVALTAIAGTGPGASSTKLALFGIQTGEFVRLLVIGFIAGYAVYAGERFRDLRVIRVGDRLRRVVRLSAARPLLIGLLATTALLLLCRDLGPPLMLIGLMGIVLTAETGVWLWTYGAFGLVAGGGAFIYWLAGQGYLSNFAHLATRIDMWLSPWASSHGWADHVARAMWAMASGGLHGFGPGHGWPKFLERSENDMVFAAVAEQLGVAGTIAILAGAVTIVLGGLFISAAQPNRFLRLVAYGISCALGLQVLVILAGNLGMLPLTGITLPLVARGNSSLLATSIALGILVHISRDAHGADDRLWQWRVALTRWIFVGLVTIVGVQTVWVQTVRADEIALKTWNGPQEDGATRDVRNPRLRVMRNSVVRAEILDRHGETLAATTEDGTREYPLGAAAMHVVGCLAPQLIGGPRGFEKRYTEQLTGLSNDDGGDLLKMMRGYFHPLGWRPAPEPLKLTLDAEAQALAYSLLSQTRSKVGAVVFLDCRSGEVLVAASSPSFDPNEFDKKMWDDIRNDDDRAVFVNRAIDGAYAPGSAFKPVVAAAALEAGMSPVFNCSHSLESLSWEYDGVVHHREGIHDSDGMPPHGRTDMAEAVRVSCNVYFAQLAVAMGPHTIANYCQDRCGFTLRGTSAAELGKYLPDAGYGQGSILVSPLQLARFMAAVGNGGEMPSYVWLAGQKAEMDRIMSRDTSKRLGRMLRDAAEEGTGRGVFAGIGYDVAGKTGTAQLSPGTSPHSWFVGFAPAKNARIAFAVIVENGGYGSRTAGPIARAVLEAAMRSPDEGKDE